MSRHFRLFRQDHEWYYFTFSIGYFQQRWYSKFVYKSNNYILDDLELKFYCRTLWCLLTVVLFIMKFIIASFLQKRKTQLDSSELQNQVKFCLYDNNKNIMNKFLVFYRCRGTTTKQRIRSEQIILCSPRVDGNKRLLPLLMKRFYSSSAQTLIA